MPTPPEIPPLSAITVMRTTLPPLENYVAYLRGIWERRWITNHGPLVGELEEKLRTELGVPHLWFINNCTTALQIALKVLDLQGEVITTPFSYVATTGTILWERLTPVFADIRPHDLTLDPARIESAITPRTSAILATHVYGLPCDVDAISTIARRHNLRVIYDAAHAFGCRLDGRSLASFGDISCLSFHATKVFHTTEGGALVVNGSDEIAERARLMRQFGHYGDDHHSIGINGKNSELHAAMGLCNLPLFPAHVGARRAQNELYRAQLAGAAGVELPETRAANFESNYGYFPVLLPSANHVERAVEQLGLIGVIPRRYFHPALNQLPYVQGGRCPVAENAAARVICVPVSDQVQPGDIRRIAGVLREVAKV